MLKKATDKTTKKVEKKSILKKKKLDKVDNHSQKLEELIEPKKVTIDNPTNDPEFLIKLFKIITNNKAKSSNSKKTIKKSSKSKKSVSTSNIEKTKPVSPILEYYDLPYRYNETVIKLLAQTPNTLFVYWDISDKDRENFINLYGENFFQNTKPVLIVHNKTMNYSFEIDIDDFANSWYIHVNDSKCDYEIELGRRPKNEYANIPNNYVYVTTSNDLESPNDHILFENIKNNVTFRNVKTHKTYTKYVSSIISPKTHKPSNIYEIYKEIYGKELVTFNDRIDFSNPSSGNPSSTFR